MHWHPQIVHFPIVLILMTLVFEFLAFASGDRAFRKAGLVTLVLALFGAGAAYWTGLMAEPAAEHIPGIHEALEMHESSGIMTLVSVGVLVFARMLVQGRQRTWWIGYMALCLLACSIVIRTAYLGGQLVYEHGAGVAPVMQGK